MDVSWAMRQWGCCALPGAADVSFVLHFVCLNSSMWRNQSKTVFSLFHHSLWYGKTSDVCVISVVCILEGF